MLGDLREDGQAPTRRRAQRRRAEWGRAVEKRHIFGNKGEATLRSLGREPYLYESKQEAKSDRRRLNRIARKRNAAHLNAAAQWSGE